MPCSTFPNVKPFTKRLSQLLIKDAIFAQIILASDVVETGSFETKTETKTKVFCQDQDRDQDHKKMVETETSKGRDQDQDRDHRTSSVLFNF